MYQLKKLTSTKKPESRDIRDLKIQRHDSNKNVKKKKNNRFNEQNNTFARAAHFFVNYFFAILAQLPHENS